MNSEDRLRGSVEANSGFKPGIHDVIAGRSLLWPALTTGRSSRRGATIIIIINVLKILIYI